MNDNFQATVDIGPYVLRRELDQKSDRLRVTF